MNGLGYEYLHPMDANEDTFAARFGGWLFYAFLGLGLILMVTQ